MHWEVFKTGPIETLLKIACTPVMLQLSCQFHFKFWLHAFEITTHSIKFTFISFCNSNLQKLWNFSSFFHPTPSKLYFFFLILLLITHLFVLHCWPMTLFTLKFHNYWLAQKIRQRILMLLECYIHPVYTSMSRKNDKNIWKWLICFLNETITKHTGTETYSWLWQYDIRWWFWTWFNNTLLKKNFFLKNMRHSEKKGQKKKINK